MDTFANPGERLLLLLNCYCNSVSMYEKSYDVFCKGVIETEVIGDKKIMYLKDILEKYVTIAKVIENVDASKCRAFKLKQ